MFQNPEGVQGPFHVYFFDLDPNYERPIRVSTFGRLMSPVTLIQVALFVACKFSDLRVPKRCPPIKNFIVSTCDRNILVEFDMTRAWLPRHLFYKIFRAEGFVVGDGKAVGFVSDL